MKNTLMAVFVTVLIYQSSFGQDHDQAIKYNDLIIDQNDKIVVVMDELVKSYDLFYPDVMDSLYSASLKSIKVGIDFATRLKPFQGDASFKNGTLSLFKVYKDALENEHKRIIELLKLPSSRYGEDEVAEFNKLINQLNTKLGGEMNKLIEIQEKFAKAHHFDVSH